MKLVSIFSICTLAAAIAGCGKGPVPAVAQAYADQFGAVQTSLFTHCPKVEGVWQLSNRSGGAFVNADGETIQHFRWFMPMLFGLSVNTRSYVAVAPSTLETVLYLSDTIPRTGGRNSLGFTTKSDKEIPCVGHGWRSAGVTDHSQNDAAARVLGLVPELPKKITQADYYARTASHELLLAIRIDFEGTKEKTKDKELVKDGYWHFLKMPRLHESPKEQGFTS